MGTLKCSRTSDHIFLVLQALQVHPNSYHLYIDFERAFNSVVRPKLWRLVERYNLPDELIQCLWLLYRDTLDAPLVGGGPLSLRPAPWCPSRLPPVPPAICLVLECPAVQCPLPPPID